MSKIINECEICGEDFEAQDSDQKLCPECYYHQERRAESERYYERLNELRRRREL